MKYGGSSLDIFDFSAEQQIFDFLKISFVGENLNYHE